MAKKSAAKKKLEAAFREVYTDEPSTVTRANVSGEKKRKMLAAVAYAKARKSGAKLPKKGKNS
jgi:ribosomal protein L23